MVLLITGNFLIPPLGVTPRTINQVEGEISVQVEINHVTKTALDLASVAIFVDYANEADLAHNFCDALLMYLDRCRAEGIAQEEALVKGSMSLWLEEERASVPLLDASGNLFPLRSALSQIEEIYASAGEIEELVYSEPVLSFS